MWKIKQGPRDDAIHEQNGAAVSVFRDLNDFSDPYESEAIGAKHFNIKDYLEYTNGPLDKFI